MKTYMLMYVLHANSTSVTEQWVSRAFGRIERIYPTWNKTLDFVDEVRNVVVNGVSEDDDDDVRVAGHSPVSWNTTLSVLETVGDRYGRWQAQECMDLKGSLMSIEDAGTGRVPLERFYGSTLNNVSWQFKESVPYLRSFGALDETNPSRLSVIIPNYINGPNNCFGTSKFHSYCCISECDPLLSHLESTLAASEASAKDIIEVVEALPSSTVQAPRKLSGFLMQRLAEIAELHGGMVPLHGRLFAQWMHHVYPHECSYPHLSGTVSSVTPRAYRQQTGQSTVLKKDAMADYVKELQAQTVSDTKEERSVQWSSEEELFVHHARPTQSYIRSFVQVILLLSVVGFAVNVLVKQPKSKSPMRLMMAAAAGDISFEKNFV
jgi:hypothetical protein